MFTGKTIMYADITSSKPVTDLTSYTVASISKTIMITAVMQQYELQKFDLDDDISDHIPFLVRNFNHPNEVITIKQLMTHTSSIQDNYVVLNQSLHWGGDNPIAMDDFLEGYLLENGTYFQTDNYYLYSPGQTWNYSNVGSCLLAYLVEVITGQDFETYCQENIFGPLGMEETSYLFANLDPENIASPYTIQGTNVTYTPQSSWPIYPIGNLKVSAMQLAKHLGMYINKGTYNDSTLLTGSTVELITDHHYINPGIGVNMGLIWFIDPFPWLYSHTGRWYGFNTIYGFNKEENYGMIWLSNGDNYALLSQTGQFWNALAYYAAHYEPFSIESLTIEDTDNDGILEAGETINLLPGIRNNTNIHPNVGNVSISLSTENPDISFLNSDRTYGTVDYLEINQGTVAQISFDINESLAPGNVEFDIVYNWNDSLQYEGTFSIYAGHSDILFVRDEVDNRGKILGTANWYTEVLDSLGFQYYFYDVGIQGNPQPEFLINFNTVIWYTGYDSVNTINGDNQSALMAFLDNGGNLFLSGQNISDELVSTDLLEDYLHVYHIEDSWTGPKLVFGVANDPIGNGLAFVVNAGDGASNQYSMCVVEPLEGAQQVFGYTSTLEGAAVRYESTNYKTVFFGFGYEAINEFENRYEIMNRILSEYFGLIVGAKDQITQGLTGHKLKITPNPLTTKTTISYHLSDNSIVSLNIYSIDGTHIKTLFDDTQKSGNHEVTFEIDNLPAGIYFCTLKTNLGMQTIKIIKL
ncbi:MAG: serine hydrolase [Bacteroidales bacterium]